MSCAGDKRKQLKVLDFEWVNSSKSQAICVVAHRVWYWPLAKKIKVYMGSYHNTWHDIDTGKRASVWVETALLSVWKVRRRIEDEWQGKKAWW